MSDEAAVLAANEAFYTAFAQRDVTAMAALWAGDAAVSCVHPGWNVLTGREDVLTSWRGILANPNQPRVVSGGARVQLYGDAAIVTCREFVSGTPLVATNVFVRQSDAWRLVAHHSSPMLQGDA